MRETLITLFLLSGAVSAISVTVSRSHVFGPMREQMEILNPWLGRLVRCAYCTSHWGSFAVCFIYQPYFLDSGYMFGLVDWFVAAMVMVGIASLWTGVVMKIHFPGPALTPPTVPKGKKEYI